MKTYIVYVNGEEKGYIKAGSHNAAEKKAIKKYQKRFSDFGAPKDVVWISYTEIWLTKQP